MTDVDVLVVGPTSENLIVTLDRLPRPEPHTVFAESSTTVLGGTSAGKALHLVDRGVAALLLTTQGDDATGEALLSSLRACGVDVRAVRTDGPSERHLNLMSARGERVSIYLQAAGEIPDEELRRARATAREALGQARAVFLDLADLSRSLIPEVTALAHEVWVDIHDYDGAEAFHRPFIEAADVILMNGDRMENPSVYLRGLVEGGKRLGVCTLGARGAIAVGSDGSFARVEAPRVDVVDPNGAGDAFAAGVLSHALRVGGAERLTGDALWEALEAGTAQATRAITSRQLSPLLEHAPPRG
ncbi:carbohydrate kinase family protein [Demequina mangrovi]|uniref:Sugar or nucleoside kinase, ribokinase family n=1 Tax=Demequina mangrovi TaxID=1043493 RepID=A0A1H6USY0_9MICO|nr:carbohydrate kinase family protein [Demequina mangrovi]SEI91400.1 Sugar or nucleoside kinase, ribokinase family [Demequina mangrovi]